PTWSATRGRVPGRSTTGARRCRSIDPNRPISFRRRHRSPTRSRAGWRAPMRPVSGGCSVGWSARVSATISIPRPSCISAGYRSGAPYRVLADTHWAFEETGLKNGDPFGQQSLNARTPGGASGLELDKISPDSPKNLVHLAKGLNPEDSGPDLVTYETPSDG